MSRRSTAKPVTSKGFWRRFLGTAVMLTFGYVGKHRYIVDGFGGWEEEFRAPVRVMTSRAYHALFMQNTLVPARKRA